MPAAPPSSSSASAVRHIVGVMTGTSIDGMDAALVRIIGEGMKMKATLVRHIARPLGNLGPPLRAAAEQAPMTAGALATLAWNFGLLHADVVGDLVSSGNGAAARPDLICIHGQTVFHAPPISWQLANPAPLAARFGCPVVSDLRQADLAAGGQGAPISPLADWILFGDPGIRRAIVNLGGFCNITILPAGSPDDIRGFDVCACNQVLDAVARAALGAPFDADGQAASAGTPDLAASDELLAILNHQRQDGRSLGTGDEASAWVRRQLGRTSPAAPAGRDLAASAVHALARCIAACVSEQRVDQAVLAGGGVRNLALADALRSHFPAGAVIRSDQLEVPADAREAMCFAILGALCVDGVPITLPQVTGCAAPAPVSGSWCGTMQSGFAIPG